MILASYYKKLENNKLKCILCPHECIIAENCHGVCRARKNFGGKLYSLVYGNPVAIHVDPIEKKPLYHFYPGMNILSFGTMGCNMQCFYCQNCEISQGTPSDSWSIRLKPEDIVKQALTVSNNIGVAYTYNEPVVFYEYMLDTAKLAKDAELKNVMVSNGYINQEPLKEIISCIDAFNIDLKAYNPVFYRKHVQAKLLPVLDTIKTISYSGRHLEITYLVIPGLNDNLLEFNEMLKWIHHETGEKTVLHLSRYFPRFKSSIPPTPVETILEMYHIAREKLKYTYIGNMENIPGNNTICPKCSNTAIKRSGYKISLEGINNKGFCIHCGESVVKHI